MTGLRQIGTTDVRVPALGFGAAAIGNLYQPVADDVAERAVQCALANGITYFDTAPHYGFGLSESRLGAALADASDLVISSKVGRLLVPVDEDRASGERHGFVDAAPFEPKFDYSYDAVMRSYEESRARLRGRRIDILYAHDLGIMTHGADHEGHFDTFMSGGYRAMRELRDSGDVGAIGLGANEWQVCEQALREGEFDVFLLAGRYTLLEQGALDSFLPMCTERNVSVVIGGPYNSGIMVQGTRSGQTLYYDYEPAPAEIVDRVRKLEAMCDGFDIPLAAAALQFPLHHPQVAAVIPGLANEQQVEDTIKLYHTPVPTQFWSALKDEGLLHAGAPVPEIAA
jgi:D-threo-aldose 1-dehydrogenase